MQGVQKVGRSDIPPAQTGRSGGPEGEVTVNAQDGRPPFSLFFLKYFWLSSCVYYTVVASLGYLYLYI